MFVYKNAIYLLIVDHASSYVEIARLAEITSSDVILHLRSILAQHGIPENVVASDTLQYASHEMVYEEGFVHCTSSLHYPQSNGKAERPMWIIKALLNKSVDPYVALFAILASETTDGPTTVNINPSDGVDTTP